MRVHIDIDPGAAATASAEVAPAAAGVETGDVAINGGSPSAELLEAVAVAGGLRLAAPEAASSTTAGGQAVETLDAGGAPR